MFTWITSRFGVAPVVTDKISDPVNKFRFKGIHILVNITIPVTHNTSVRPKASRSHSTHKVPLSWRDKWNRYKFHTNKHQDTMKRRQIGHKPREVSRDTRRKIRENKPDPGYPRDTQTLSQS
ncbi:hypothetical protein HanPSC8_Chr05g0204841 [Helianthus annuus]|nr:hypothetical protein HanPSC8_Chr05g0204841 [Helianthus annuus]